MSIINEDNAGSALRIDEYDIPAYIRYSPEYKESIEFRESINNGEFNNIPAIFIKLRYEGVGELIYGRECLSIGKSKHLFIKK